MNATPIKVLVIDDEPPIRKLLRMGLSTQGYEILEAPGGKMALELLEQNPALVTTAMNLVFSIENETASTCGAA